jgi:hypothetical protein
MTANARKQVAFRNHCTPLGVEPTKHNGSLEAFVMPYGTIIFIALILVVACSILYWLSALCGNHPKRNGKALKKHPLSNWK